jgi:hypothetical protein
VLEKINEPTILQQERVATKFEEIGSSKLGEHDRMHLKNLQAHQAPLIEKQEAVTHFQEKENVQVIRQENIERHVQPVITEVRDQTIVQEVVHPIVRKVYETPIVREVGTGTTTLVHNDKHMMPEHTQTEVVHEEKPGIMTRIKDKLHLGHHHEEKL